MNERIEKVTRHVCQNEGLIFEKSTSGKRAFDLPPLVDLSFAGSKPPPRQQPKARNCIASNAVK
jgi:hypothetical protein